MAPWGELPGPFPRGYQPGPPVDVRVPVHGPAIVHVEVSVEERAGEGAQDPPHASGTTMVRRREPWSPEGARMRLLGVIVSEAARAGRAKWPELTAIIRTLADRLGPAVDKPEQSPIAALEGAEGS